MTPQAYAIPGLINEKEPYRVIYKLLKVTRKQLLSKSRKREIVTGRYFLMNMLKNTTNRSLDSIGMEFNRDHSTVFNSIKTYNNLYETDKDFRALADEFNSRVG